MTLVFLYGFLKRAGLLHYMLREPGKGRLEFKGHGYTAEKYPLVVIEEYQTPYLLNRPGLGKHVIGELYECDDVMLHTLDDLEDTPHWYIRKDVQIHPVPGCDGDQCALQNDEHCWVRCEKTGQSAPTSPVIAIAYVGDSFSEHLFQLETHASFQVAPWFSIDDLLAKYTKEEIKAKIKLICQGSAPS